MLGAIAGLSGLAAGIAVPVALRRPTAVADADQAHQAHQAHQVNEPVEDRLELSFSPVFHPDQAFPLSEMALPDETAEPGTAGRMTPIDSLVQEVSGGKGSDLSVGGPVSSFGEPIALPADTTFVGPGLLLDIRA